MLLTKKSSTLLKGILTRLLMWIRGRRYQCLPQMTQRRGKRYLFLHKTKRRERSDHSLPQTTQRRGRRTQRRRRSNHSLPHTILGWERRDHPHTIQWWEGRDHTPLHMMQRRRNHITLRTITLCGRGVPYPPPNHSGRAGPSSGSPIMLVKYTKFSNY
jgi:hypothetical protein